MGPGTLLGGKYRLVELIGEGAMGSVWSAKNELTQRTFALKLLGGQHIGGAEARKRLLREASASGQLAHKNVVEVYDVGVTESGDPFLVMQLLKGEALDHLLGRAGRLEAAPAIEIGASVARALVVAHAAGVVHRDLKPANIYLHQDPDLGTVVKVLDFGVSKVLTGETSSTMTGTAIGSPAYMSPEQAKGEKTVDHRTDIWALGVVLFEMLAGARPFQGETPYAVVAEIISGKIPSLRDVVPGADVRLVELIARCLERDVSKRIASATEVLDAMTAAAGGRARIESLAGDTKSATFAAPTKPAVKVSPAPIESAIEPPTVQLAPVHIPEAPFAAPATTTPGSVPKPDATQTSTSALVRTSRGLPGSRPGITQAFASVRDTLASRWTALSGRARIQLAAAAGVAVVLVGVASVAVHGTSGSNVATSSPVPVESVTPPRLEAPSSAAPIPQATTPGREITSIESLQVEPAPEVKNVKKSSASNPSARTTGTTSKKEAAAATAHVQSPPPAPKKTTPKGIPTTPW